jgi:hypothetical protein
LSDAPVERGDTAHHSHVVALPTASQWRSRTRARSQAVRSRELGEQQRLLALLKLMPVSMTKSRAVAKPVESLPNAHRPHADRLAGRLADSQSRADEALPTASGCRASAGNSDVR